MSGFQDVRDLMEISTPPAEGSTSQRAPKRQKVVERRPDGITRELFALLGNAPPPVAIVETKFKEKPKWMGKAQPWVERKFSNPARNDGFVFRHWERKSDSSDEASYPFAKFNVQVQVPDYDDIEYESLKDDDWTRAETDYLFSLCREYDLRFPVIWDRYSFPDKKRSQEDLKARYYFVARKLMELRTPQSEMTREQAQQYELLNFDKEHEVQRKNMAAVLFARTPAEVEKEEHLLTELKRIVDTEDRMMAERKDLYARLNMPQSVGNIAQYQNSAGLMHLKDQLAPPTDKSKKRKSVAIANGEGGASTPTTANGTSQREKDAVAAQQARRQMRKLSPAEEQRFGVSYPEKCGTGIKFRSNMIQTTVKGGTLQKIGQALQQLNIGKLVMPTVKTVEKYEELQTAAGTMLDAKKMSEKLDQEIRTLEKQLGEDSGKESS